MPASWPLFRCTVGFLRVLCREPHPQQESSSADKRDSGGVRTKGPLQVGSVHFADCWHPHVERGQIDPWGIGSLGKMQELFITSGCVSPPLSL